jgi:hypothetical protein
LLLTLNFVFIGFILDAKGYHPYNDMHPVDIICQHLMRSGFHVHPPWHPFGVKMRCVDPNRDARGSARVYIGETQKWLYTTDNSTYLVDIMFGESALVLEWPTPSWSPSLQYSDPDLFTSLYDKLTKRAREFHNFAVNRD